MYAMLSLNDHFIFLERNKIMKKMYEKPIFNKTNYISLETISNAGYLGPGGETFTLEQFPDCGCDYCPPDSNYDGTCATEVSCCL